MRMATRESCRFHRSNLKPPAIGCFSSVVSCSTASHYPYGVGKHIVCIYAPPPAALYKHAWQGRCPHTPDEGKGFPLAFPTGSRSTAAGLASDAHRSSTTVAPGIKADPAAVRKGVMNALRAPLHPSSAPASSPLSTVPDLLSAAQYNSKGSDRDSQ